MVGHNFHRLNFDIMIISKVIDSAFHILNELRCGEYGLAILCNPYNMVREIVEITVFVLIICNCFFNLM